MKFFMSVITVLVAILAAFFLISGCGSDDDPVSLPPTHASPFSGDYHYVQMTGLPFGSPYRSETGRFVTVRKDSVRFEEAYRTFDGSVEGPLVPPARALSFHDDRGVAFTDPADWVIQGRFSGDGSVAVLHGDTLNPHVGFMFATRMNPAPVQADLEGYWLLVQFGLVPEPAPSTDLLGLGAFGRVEINNLGAAGFHFHTYNLDGQVDPLPVVHMMSELVVDDEGWVVWNNLTTNEVDFRGGLSSDGNLMLLGAMEVFNGQAGIRVLVREGLATSMAEVSGNYLAGGFTWLKSQPPSGGAFSLNGNMVVDGSGDGLWTVLVRTSEPTMPVTYAVEVEGIIAVDYLSENVLQGGTGTGGEFLIMTGPFGQSGVPWFQAMVR